MNQAGQESEKALRAELERARENEARWVAMSPGTSAEAEEFALWAKIANLRRSEVQRLEELVKRNRMTGGPASTDTNPRGR